MARKKKLINRELSWLSFNDRVLQEAYDQTVPLLERLKFLGIFSSNLDEFFRVRVATHKRMLHLKSNSSNYINRRETRETLQDIYNKVVIQQVKFNNIYNQLLEEFKSKNVFFVNEKQLNIQQTLEVRKFFKEEIINTIFPLILNERKTFPFLRDNTVYLACKLSNSITKEKKYALIPLPTKVKKRFYQLPKQGNSTYMMFIDDVIRCNLDVVFSSFEYNVFEAYTIKLTRDAEIDIDNDISLNILDTIQKSLKQRKKGQPVRLIYDQEMPNDFIKFIYQKLALSKDELIPGQRYHNFRDFIGFPDIKKTDLKYQKIEPLYIPELDKAKTMFNAIRQRDYLISHPYQPFSYIIRMLREAAIDPDVISIKMTLYRVAENSNVVNALINAVKNGKKVTVMMELKARFDEEHNIYWSNKLKEEGATVLFTIPSMKVHSKLCLITRKEKNGNKLYAHLGTGNYNGDTARVYCDHSVLTCNTKITTEINRVFSLIDDFNPSKYKFTHLLVAPINLRSSILRLIDAEIRNKKAGKEAYIIMKMNSLTDPEIIEKLYEASKAGVKVQIIVRSIQCLLAGVKGLSENIEAISIVDKYLEHARIYVFCNAGKEKMYMGSADMMSRNLDSRVEVVFPITSAHVAEELKAMLNIQLNDNCKSRILDEFQINEYKPNQIPRIRAQVEFYNYLKKKYNHVNTYT
ncbi:MAG: polyphosphate kinase 1 [Bacteroidia bacterium]|nr:polyphosphate kinase 1 [Bacteroidia bacterium]